MMFRRSLLSLAIVGVLAAPAADARVKDEDTIKSLEEKTVEEEIGEPEVIERGRGDWVTSGTPMRFSSRSKDNKCTCGEPLIKTAMFSTFW